MNEGNQIEEASRREAEDEALRKIAQELKREEPKRKPVNQLAGGYWILVDGYYGQDKESYELTETGKAIWIATFEDGTTQSKMGTWESQNNNQRIKITIKGNSGEIVETYNLVNGKYRDGDRYLKKFKSK